MDPVSVLAATSVSATSATARRRMLVPVRFALIRLRAHAERSAVVPIGIAIAAGVLALTAGRAGAVQDPPDAHRPGAPTPAATLRSPRAQTAGPPPRSRDRPTAGISPR